MHVASVLSRISAFTFTLIVGPGKSRIGQQTTTYCWRYKTHALSLIYHRVGAGGRGRGRGGGRGAWQWGG